MKTKTVILFFLLAIVTFSFGYGCYLMYLKTTEENILSIQESFYGVLSYEGEVRLEKSGAPFSFSNNLPDENIKPGFISLQTEDSVSYIKKNPQHETKSAFEKRAHAIQTVLLLSGYPIKATTIDSLLTEKLHQQNIYATIGIRYVNNRTGEVEESKPDDLVYHESSTDLILLGLYDEIGVQAFYRMPFFFIVRQELILFVLFTTLWLAILSALIVFFKRKPGEKVRFIPIEETKETQEEERLLPICPSVYYNPVRLTLQYNNRVVSFTKQMAALFTAFLESHDYYLSNEKIEKQFWPDSTNNRQSRVQLIKRLRKALEPIPRLNIKNVNKTGYQLQITKK